MTCGVPCLPVTFYFASSKSQSPDFISLGFEECVSHTAAYQ